MTTPTVWVAINRQSGTVLTARKTRDSARNYAYYVDDDAEAPEDVEKHTDFVEYVPAELLRYSEQALTLEKLTSEGLRETVDIMAREADGITRDRDAYRDMLRQVLGHRSSERAWARSAGITLTAVGDILSRLEGEDISRGRAVELLRELAVAAVEERTGERTAELESKLTMMVDANRDLTRENNVAEREEKVHRLNEQLLDRVIDLVGKDPVGGIQKLEERIAELESTVRRHGHPTAAEYERAVELLAQQSKELRALRWLTCHYLVEADDDTGAVDVLHEDGSPYLTRFSAVDAATELGWKD